MLVAELQSWGQCAGCGMNLWIAPSVHEERCSCSCGGLSLHNGTKSGDSADISEADFQVILDVYAAL